MRHMLLALNRKAWSWSHGGGRRSLVARFWTAVRIARPATMWANGRQVGWGVVSVMLVAGGVLVAGLTGGGDIAAVLAGGGARAMLG